MYHLLLLLLFVCSLQSSDLITQLNESYNKQVMPIHLSPIELHSTSQLVLPTYYEHLTIELEQVDSFTGCSIRSLIEETKQANTFCVIASYRTTQNNETISAIQNAHGNRLAHLLRSGIGLDQDTLRPIVTADFHEFCYIKGQLTVRYIGNLEIAKQKSPTLLHFLTKHQIPEPITPNNALSLALVHANNKDFDRTLKYLRNVSNKVAQSRMCTILQLAAFALKHNHREIAIEALKHISLNNLAANYLLYKMHNEENTHALCELATVVANASSSESVIGDHLYLAYQYLSEARKLLFMPKTYHVGYGFLSMSLNLLKDITQKYNNHTAIFCLFSGLSMIDQKEHYHWLTPERLRYHADQYALAINNDTPKGEFILHYKKELPQSYERVIELIRKYSFFPLFDADSDEIATMFAQDD